MSPTDTCLYTLTPARTELMEEATPEEEAVFRRHFDRLGAAPSRPPASPAHLPPRRRLRHRASPPARHPSLDTIPGRPQGFGFARPNL